MWYIVQIYIENATSVNINNIRPHNKTVGYQRNKVVVDADYIKISNSHFAKIKKIDSVQIDRERDTVYIV